jgi:hypothetical protein
LSDDSVNPGDFEQKRSSPQKNGQAAREKLTYRVILSSSVKQARERSQRGQA